MKKIIVFVVSIILITGIALAYTTTVKVNGIGIRVSSGEGRNVKITPKVDIDGWYVESGNVELTENGEHVAEFTTPQEDVSIVNVVLGVNSPRTLAEGETWYSKGGTTIAKSSITSINIEDSYTPASYVEKWDASATNDGSVMAYVEDDGKGNSTYKLTITGNGTGKIIANMNSGRTLLISIM